MIRISAKLFSFGTHDAKYSIQFYAEWKPNEPSEKDEIAARILLTLWNNFHNYEVSKTPIVGPRFMSLFEIKSNG